MPGVSGTNFAACLCREMSYDGVAKILKGACARPYACIGSLLGGGDDSGCRRAATTRFDSRSNLPSVGASETFYVAKRWFVGVAGTPVVPVIVNGSKLISKSESTHAKPVLAGVPEQTSPLAEKLKSGAASSVPMACFVTPPAAIAPATNKEEATSNSNTVWFQRSEKSLDEFIKGRIVKLTSSLAAQKAVPYSDKLLTNIETAYRHTAKRLRRHGSYKPSRRKSDSFQLYQDPKVRLCAVVEVTLGRDLPKGRPIPTEVELIRRVKAVRSFWKLKEPVRKVRIRKPDGSYRPTLDFGPVRFTQQTLFKWIVLAQGVSNPIDFSLPGRGGHHAAAQQIGFHIEIQNLSFWAVADFKNAFASVSKAAVDHVIDVDKRLMRYVVVPSPDHWEIVGSYPYKGDPTFTHNWAPGGGLPQGSAHASLVWSAITDAVLRLMPKDKLAKAVVGYADNIALGAPTLQSARHALTELQTAVAKFCQLAGLAPGALSLHEQSIGYGREKPGYIQGHKLSASAVAGIDRREAGLQQYFDGIPVHGGVEFCGYRIYLHPGGEGMKCSPSGKAWKKLHLKIEAMWDHHPDADDETLVQFAVEEFQKWERHFPLWRLNRVGDWEDQRLSLFKSLLGHSLGKRPGRPAS